MTDKVTITVTPAPANATPLRPDPDHGCRCSILDGRCDTHAAMMRAVYAAWNGSDASLSNKIRALADGYGYRGSMLDMGTWDWSGVRDSTEATVEAMFEAIGGSL